MIKNKKVKRMLFVQAIVVNLTGESFFWTEILIVFHCFTFSNT